ncbi:MAG TPA: cytochrome b [Burkholderiaceae bacterium]|jgi:cytochrome b561|nr:cytochrome b [Burkholderiaceae bacterium]
MALETTVDGSDSRYPLTAVILHWIVAGGVLALLATGAYMVGIPKNTEQRAVFFNLHKSLGILTAGFIAALIAWRSWHRAPDLPSTIRRWERRAASLNHVLFYLLMVVVTVTGYLTSSFSKYGPKLFGVPLPHWGWDDALLRGRFADGHRLVAWVFATLIALHAIAALKHLIVDRDRVFQRMLPARAGRDA